MPGKAKFQWKGSRELLDGLADMKSNLVGPVTGQALQRGGAIVRERARTNVREDTGNLKRSIGTKLLPDEKLGRRTLIVGVRRQSLPDTSRSRKTGRDWPSRRAHFEEFGTEKQAAHPFLRPAMDASVEDVLRVWTETYRAAIAAYRRS